MTEEAPTRVSAAGSTRRRSGAPGLSRCSCPTTSSSEAGRIRTASGASGRAAGVPASSAPTESKRSTSGAYVLLDARSAGTPPHPALPPVHLRAQRSGDELAQGDPGGQRQADRQRTGRELGTTDHV